MKCIKYVLPLIMFFLFNNFYANGGDNRKAIDVAKSIVEKTIRESAFEFKTVIQEEAVGVQIIDFENEFGIEKGVYFAASNLISKKDTTLYFGLSYSGGIKIWLNGELIINEINYSGSEFKEIAYGLFDFQKIFEIKIKEGENRVLIKLVSGENKPVVYLREIPEEAESPLSVGFANIYKSINQQNKKWLLLGAFPFESNFENSINKIYLPEESFREYYNYNGEIFSWNIQKDNLLRELVVDPSNSYNRESYVEWNYANGATMFGILSVAEKTKEKSYKDFVKRFCDFTLAEYDYFKYQYNELHALRGINHRIFRKSMLDDASGPALPFVQLLLEDKNENYKSIVYEMADYVENEQVRLPDGTLCRPEPVEMTLWADDLFMSVPFLLRMAQITGERKYYDDAALQSLKFYELLFDENIGLYKHGWFQKKNEKSVAYWGRANGWIVWANSELLMHLPKEHQSYKKILSNYKKHIKGLLKQQSESGMWHQVLDKHDSFKETSCTAMYIMGILRGVKNGWLDKSYKQNALKAWNELKKNIKDDGTVIDICRGTGIGYDLQFYYDRKRFDNDPRGLGAVLNAALEISEIE